MPIRYDFTNKMGNVCSSLNGLSSLYCLPVKVQCVETDDDGFLFLCDKKPCDINCNWEQVSTIPFVKGDKIHFQTQFRDLVNSDIKNPTLGWGDWVMFELYNAESGNLITSNLGSGVASRYYVCHNGVNAYQVIEIDTDAIQVPCSWFIKFLAYNGTDDESQLIDERCSHVFSEVNECQETHTVEGLYEKFDCVGNYYGEPDCVDDQQLGAEVFKYSNKTRIEATLKKLAPEIETEDDRNIITDNYEFSTKYAKTPGQVFLHNYLVSWYTNVLAAKTVKIDDEKLKYISNFAVNYDQQNPNSSVVEWSWKIKCNSCNAG